MYVAFSLAVCLLIGYPVAYYTARHAGRWKGVILILIILPPWISYMMRMLAWVNLLQADGYVNRFLMFTHVMSQPRDWLGGRPSTVILALVYGYIPYLILPLFASLDRIDRSHLEAARDPEPAPGRRSAPSRCHSPRQASSAVRKPGRRPARITSAPFAAPLASGVSPVAIVSGEST